MVWNSKMRFLVSRFQKRVSGPLLDRVDIHIEVPRVEFEKLTDDRAGEPAEAVRERVEGARTRQRQRFGSTDLNSNADMGPGEVRKYCALDDPSRALVRQAMIQLQLTARAFHRVLKLARTIAGRAGEGEIASNHVAERVQYRARWGG